MSKTDTDDGYGISYLAKELDMDPSNVRNALRRLKVEKTDNRYSWGRKSEADAIVKRIRDNKREQPEALKKGKASKADKADTGKSDKKGASSKVNKDALEKGKADRKAAKAGKDAKADKKGKKDSDKE